MASESTKKTDADLKKEITEMRESLRVFRFSVAGSKSRNVREGRKTRRTIARHLTEVNSRRQGKVETQ